MGGVCAQAVPGSIAGIVNSVHSVNSPVEVRASDLVGCRFRLRQRAVHPDVPPLPAALERQPQIDAARAVVFDLLPVRRAVGDGRRRSFVRRDLDPAFGTDEETLQALADGAHLITNATLRGTIDGCRVVAEIDVLVRVDGLLIGGDEVDTGPRYMPVAISNHRVAREHPQAHIDMVFTNRLGLSAPLTVNAKARHHTIDGYRLAIAELLLREHGLATGRGALIGQDRTRAYVGDITRFIPPVRAALAAPVPSEPKRLKQCASCRFWPLCHPRLEEMDDISLVLPGGGGDAWRERGYPTVQSLIDADVGEPSAIARAWRAGIPVLRRQGPITMPRADVEVDVDMEAYLDQGAYLWGAFDGATYRPFVTWSDVGGEAEEANFAAFWSWLMATRAAAHAAGQSFKAYCYAAGGENHWLKASARRFTSVDAAEVQAFIASDEWVDVFAHARRHLVGTDGLGLKVLGPVVGFEWEDDDVDGERSIVLRRAARFGDARARAMLVRYNEDDCRATRAVRDFLTAGAPGLPVL